MALPSKKMDAEFTVEGGGADILTLFRMWRVAVKEEFKQHESISRESRKVMKQVSNILDDESSARSWPNPKKIRRRIEKAQKKNEIQTEVEAQEGVPLGKPPSLSKGVGSVSPEIAGSIDISLFQKGAFALLLAEADKAMDHFSRLFDQIHGTSHLTGAQFPFDVYAAVAVLCSLFFLVVQNSDESKAKTVQALFQRCIQTLNEGWDERRVLALEAQLLLASQWHPRIVSDSELRIYEDLLEKLHGLSLKKGGKYLTFLRANLLIAQARAHLHHTNGTDIQSLFLARRNCITLMGTITPSAPIFDLAVSTYILTALRTAWAEPKHNKELETCQDVVERQTKECSARTLCLLALLHGEIALHRKSEARFLQAMKLFRESLNHGFAPAVVAQQVIHWEFEAVQTEVLEVGLQRFDFLTPISVYKKQLDKELAQTEWWPDIQRRCLEIVSATVINNQKWTNSETLPRLKKKLPSCMMNTVLEESISLMIPNH